MKQWTKIFVLVACLFFVFTLAQGCNNSTTAKSGEKIKSEKQTQSKSGKLIQNDIKKARLVSAENLELKSQIEQLQKNIDDLNTKLATSQKENEDLKKANEQSMEMMLSAMSSGIEEQTAKLNEENQQLKNQVEILKKELQELKK
jgi:hypothetical protein